MSRARTRKAIALRRGLSFLLLLATTACARERPPAPSLPPLLDAAARADAPALRSLLARGAAVEEKDRHGWTALHWAATAGSAEAARLLLERGADVDARSELAMTPLHLAAAWGKADLADLLLRNGADPRARNAYGMTPLHEATTAEVTRVLLARGAPVGERDDRGMTPLHLARTGKVAKVLLEAGADPFSRAGDGRRPMDMATGGDWERDGLVVYAGRASARLRAERGALAVEIRNVSEREVGPLALTGESPACDVEISPRTVTRLDPGQLLAFQLALTRRAGASEGEHPLRLALSAAGQPGARIELRVDTTRAETPADRGMVRIGKATLRRAPSRLQYAVFAAVPVILAGLWLMARRRR